MKTDTKAGHTLFDFTWHCGCRTYQDGLNNVWDKCSVHAAAPELLEQLKKAVDCLPNLNKWDREPMLATIAKATVNKGDKK